jgi:dihydropyrimidine dehydrogenase (NAD+) subunit PreA
LKAVALRCAASIARTGQAPLVGCGGIMRWQDAAEFMAVGASLVEMCTAVMWNGYEIIQQLTEGLSGYLKEHEFASISQLTGKALPRLGGYEDIDLSLRLHAFVTDEKCNGCGKCQTACDGGGFEAISVTGKKAWVDPEKCDGCGLCVDLCPTSAIDLLPA